MKGSVTYDYDQILSHIGEFGKFQKIISLLLSVTSAVGGLAVVVFPFTAFVQNYRCRVPNYEMNANEANYFHSNRSLPHWYGNLSIDASNRCRNLVVEDDRTSKWATNKDQDFIEEFCDTEDLVFDDSVMKTTLVVDYGLVCDNSGTRTILNITYMLGLLVGGYLFGWISDTFGRTKALTLGVFLVSVAGFSGAWATGPYGVYIFSVLRFLTGVGAMACFMISFVLIVEHVGSKFTMLVGIWIDIPFAVGEAILGLEAFFIRDWRRLQMVAHLPLLVCTLIYWTCPESVRWCLAKGKVGEAQKIIKTIAKTNGKRSPDFLFENGLENISENLEEDDTEHPKQSSLLAMLRSSNILLKRFINMSFQWFSVTLCYYGLSFASTSLSDDVFTNFMLSVLIEIPGYIFCLLTLNTCGRRPILSLCQVVSGLACISCSFLYNYNDSTIVTIRLILSLVGKFGASAAYAIVYLYTAELFPTCVRNQSVGVCALTGKLGGFITMLLELLAVYWVPAPVLVMGVTATIAGVTAAGLPETRGGKLTDTLEEAEMVGAGEAVFPCCNKK